MGFTLHGIPVSRGIVIGRVHLLASAALEVPHYLMMPGQIDDEVARLDEAIATVVNELYQLQSELPASAPAEFAALVDLHRLILQDPLLSEEPARLVRERRYNAEWALTTQLQAVVEQFEEMDDEYIASRRADVEQVVERVLKLLTGSANSLTMVADEADAARRNGNGEDFEPMIVIAHDIAPADMLQFKKKVFAGFATDLGSLTAHTAILAKSLDIPAVVGLGQASRLLHQDECVIVDGEAGVLIVDPSPIVLDEYRLRKRDLELANEKLKRLARMQTRTLDDVAIELYANIELPDDCDFANEVGATGIGLYRTEFLFMTRDSMPDEEEQFEAYRRVVTAMTGRPVTIRTLDIGADKTPNAARLAFGDGVFNTTNPALGLRAIRFCLAEPQMFLVQLRAILRASAFGPVKLLIPMIAHPQEVDSALVLIATAKGQLDARGIAYDHDMPVGGMIEIPAAALSLAMFAKRLDFFSIGTNDLIQYTLAIDRTDNAVAHLYDPLHPAVLQLIAQVIASANRLGVPVSVCGEMAGDPMLARLLLGLGLRQFSMHPAQLLAVKYEVLRSDVAACESLAKKILSAGEPDRIRVLVDRLRAA
ncbi:MAG: phosphoenolpyruvate--protein phosphotransferase [Burkholderiaceae bacterium]